MNDITRKKRAIDSQNNELCSWSTGRKWLRFLLKRQEIDFFHVWACNSDIWWAFRQRLLPSYLHWTDYCNNMFIVVIDSCHCGCHLAMRSWPSASWAPVVQHWTSLGSPAGPDGAKMSFGRSPARHLQETKSHKTLSWNKGKSILFPAPFRPPTTSGSVCFSNCAPLIWNFLPQPIRTCTSYTSFKVSSDTIIG